MITKGQVLNSFLITGPFFYCVVFFSPYKVQQEAKVQLKQQKNSQINQIQLYMSVKTSLSTIFLHLSFIYIQNKQEKQTQITINSTSIKVRNSEHFSVQISNVWDEWGSSVDIYPFKDINILCSVVKVVVHLRLQSFASVVQVQLAQLQIWGFESKNAYFLYQKLLKIEFFTFLIFLKMRAFNSIANSSGSIVYVHAYFLRFSHTHFRSKQSNTAVFITIIRLKSHKPKFSPPNKPFLKISI
eukprot:TRINITY_DN9826_c0_g1_i2.p1 TRINITY_DN9826_c0_g1~~TRINITY_DN9826_c0_g1_i2.p1  ORF type:complete len:242 (-),score=-8.81 TRINITY_DN9826_c0_g1_i2:182-907(-)